MAEHQDFVDHVEQIMTRMFDPSTSNEEKQAIEQQLQAFKQTNFEYGLVQCYHMLTLSKNQYVLWLASSMLEEIVTKKWRKLSAADQGRLSQFILEQLLSNGLALPPFVFTKLAVVYVTIGKLDWPDRFPDFFSGIEALIINESSSRVGLCLMRLCAEEFVKEKDAVVLTARKTQLKSLLIAQLPSIVACLGNTLSRISDMLHDPNIDPVKFQEYDGIATLVLKALVQFVEWAPVGQYLSKHLVSLLFKFTTYRCIRHDRGAHNEMANSGIAALECITIMIAKKCVPREFKIFIVELTTSLMTVLHALTEASSDTAGTSESSMIDLVGEEYLDKMTEFISVFFENHLARLERHHDFRLNDFLQLLLSYTCRQPHSIGFINCINLWSHFVTHIEESREQNMRDTSSVNELEVYERGLTALSLHVIDRIQFETNRIQLEELEDEYITPSSAQTWTRSLENELGIENNGENEVEESDYDVFINECVSLIARTAELPACAAQLLNKTVPKIQSSLQAFYRFHEQFNTSNVTKSETQAIHDMSAIIKVICAVGGRFYSFAQDEKTLYEGYQLLRMVTEMTAYTSQHRLHGRGSHFERLYLNLITGLQQCCGCLYALYQQNAELNEISQAVDAIIDVVFSALDSTILPCPEAIMLHAVGLVSTLSRSVASKHLHGSGMQRLRGSIHSLTLALPLRVQAELYRAMSNILLPRNLAVRSDEWEERQAVYVQFASPITSSLAEVRQTLQHNEQRISDSQMFQRISRDAIILSALADAVADMPKPAKDSFYGVVSEGITPGLELLKMYMNSFCTGQRSDGLALAQRLVQMFASVFRSVRKELGSNAIEEVITVCLTLFRRDEVAQRIGNAGESGISLLNNFLLFLNVVVAEPTNAVNCFINGILDLCCGTLKPLIFDGQYSDSMLPYFLSLVQQILDKHFRYFIATSSTFDADGVRAVSFTSEIAMKYFVMIFEAIGSILQRTNAPPRVCKQAILMLTRLNTSHNLYAIKIFQSTLRASYIHTILQQLISGSLDLLRDESCNALYELAASDWAMFYNETIPHFLSDALSVVQPTVEVLRTTLGSPTDLPTFMINVVAFVSDYRVLTNRE